MWQAKALWLRAGTGSVPPIASATWPPTTCWALPSRLALLLYFLFAVLFLVLRYGVLPNIDLYKGDIERMASRALGNPGHDRPHLRVLVRPAPQPVPGRRGAARPPGRQVLRLPSVSATLSWWSVAGAECASIAGNDPARPGRAARCRRPPVSVAGIVHRPEQAGDGKGATGCFDQREIVIREGRCDWTDELRNAPAAGAANLNLLLRNSWRRHQFALTGHAAGQPGRPLDVRADFTHPAFTAARLRRRAVEGRTVRRPAQHRPGRLEDPISMLSGALRTAQRQGLAARLGDAWTTPSWPASPPTWRWHDVSARAGQGLAAAGTGMRSARPLSASEKLPPASMHKRPSRRSAPTATRVSAEQLFAAHPRRPGAGADHALSEPMWPPLAPSPKNST
jgi:hypothetical protein